MKVTDYYRVLSADEAENIVYTRLSDPKQNKNQAVAAIMKVEKTSQKEAEFIYNYRVSQFAQGKLEAKNYGKIDRML